MHQHWLYAGRYYQATEDEHTVHGDPTSECIKKDSVVYCIKCVEVPLVGKLAVFQNHHTGQEYIYKFKNRPERVNFVAINPCILSS